MIKKALFLLLVILAVGSPVTHAQHLLRSPDLQLELAEETAQLINRELDSLYAQLARGAISREKLDPENAPLTENILSYLQELEGKEEGGKWQKQLVNLYPLQPDTYSLDIAYLGYSPDEARPALRMLFNLVVEVKEQTARFSLPIKYLTRHWQQQQVGRIRYFHESELDLDNAQLFDSKNEIIAQKLGVAPESLDFYLCDNYQDVLRLLGIKYDSEQNGTVADGYGVVAGTIFSIQGNEDFSHDMFHYYSGKINERARRNWVAEEGFAYSWGNAYYVDPDGRMIGQDLLVSQLRQYLEEHPEVSLLELFESNTRIYPELHPKISVRSVIAGLVCDEVERRKGKAGILSLINSGKRQPDYHNFFRALDQLIGINKNNFEAEVTRLLAESAY